MRTNPFFQLKTFCNDDGDGGQGGGGSSMLPDGDAGAGGEGAPGWFLSEGVAGEGNAPEWFKHEKYKSVSDQAAAYTELEKKFGGAGELIGAPGEGEEYEITLPEGIEAEIAADDPLVKAFTDKARELNLSQKAFTELFQAYLTAENAMMTTNMEKEMEALGNNASARVKALADWGAGNLSEEQNQAFRDICTSARNIELVEALVAKSRESRMPDPNDTDTSNAGGMTADKLREMRYAKTEDGQLRMSVDAAYKQKVEKAYSDFYGEEPGKQMVG